MKLKFANALSLALIMAMLFTSVGLADNVQNDVVVGGNDTITSGGSTTINYRINENNGDGQTGCNAADATPATVTINTPAGVTVDTSGFPGNQVTLTFTSCGTNQSAVFSSSTVGNYSITVSVSDSGTGTYNVNPATFMLKVTAPPVQNQTISVTSAAPANAVYGSSFNVAATGGGSGNPVVITSSGSCTGGGNGSASITMISGTGACSVFYNQAAGTGYNAAPQVTNSTTAQKANATIVVTPYNVTYDGNAHTATGTATGIGSDGALTGLDLSGTTHTAAGTYNNDPWTFAGNSNYNAASGTVNDSIGQASSTTTVTCDPGPFTYSGSAFTPCSASYTTSDGLSGSLTVGYSDNTNAGTVTASAAYVGDANHAGSSDTENFTIGQASSTTTVICNAGPFTYNGSAQTPCSASYTTSDGLSGSLTVAYSDNTNAGTATASATYTSDANHAGSSDTENFTIGQADAVCVISGYTGVYDGAAHGAIGSCTGVGGESLAGLDLGASFTDVPGGTAAWTFTDATGNYNDASGTAEIVISKANATIMVNGYTGVYDGAAHGATGSATGVLGESLAGLDLGASFTNVPGGMAAWTFTDTTGNYNDASGTAEIVISKANATCTVTGYNVLFDNADHTATGSCTGVLVESLSGLNLSGTTHKLAGTYNDTWTFTDVTGNYNNTSGTVIDTIGAWTLRGFHQPVDMGGVYNTVRNGSTVPLKFEISAGSTELTDIAAVQQPLVINLVTCQTGAVEDLIETVATGGTSLRYDTSGGQFIYNWKTPSTAGKCYRVTMTALDGSSLVAFFKLK